MSEYTKGEWEEGFKENQFNSTWYGVYCGNKTIAHMMRTVGEFNEESANAKRIVQCVNAHDGLVEALKMANIMLLQTYMAEEKNDCMVKIQQALTKAGE